MTVSRWSVLRITMKLPLRDGKKPAFSSGIFPQLRQHEDLVRLGLSALPIVVGPYFCKGSDWTQSEIRDAEN